MSDCDAGYCQYDSLISDLAESRERIADLERQLAAAKSEINVMQPLAEWAANHPHFPRQLKAIYEARKPK